MMGSSDSSESSARCQWPWSSFLLVQTPFGGTYLPMLVDPALASAKWTGHRITSCMQVRGKAELSVLTRTVDTTHDKSA